MVPDGASLCLVLIGFHASTVIVSVSYDFYGMIYRSHKFGHKQTDPDQGQVFMQQKRNEYAYFSQVQVNYIYEHID